MLSEVSSGITDWRSTLLPFKSWLYSCTLALFLLAKAAQAQFSGSVQGLVQDPSGAGVAKASVSLVNTATSVTEKTTSDDSGNYRFVSLAPGSYKITASAAGFSATDVQATLTTGQNLNVLIPLSVASASTAIEVTAAAPVVDTSETRNQQTIQSEELSALPLAGRNMISLVTLAPGVTGRGLSASGSPGSAADNFSTEQQVDASANGRSSNANMYVVDGLDVTSNIRPGVLNLTPNPDSVQESTTAVNTYSVEYGRGSSLVFTMTTKIRDRPISRSGQRLLYLPEFLGRHGIQSQLSSLPQQQRFREHRGTDTASSPILFLLRYRASSILSGCCEYDHV